MKLKTLTEHAVRVMIYLGEHKGITPYEELSQRLGIAKNYLPKVTRPLCRAGLIGSSSGCTGGIWLTAPPKAVTIMDIMEIMDDSVALGGGSGSAADTAYAKAQKCLEDYFSSITLENLMENHIPDIAGEKPAATSEN